MSHLTDHHDTHHHDTHHHGHGDVHRGRAGSLRHLLGGLSGTHSHDAADQIDDALEADAAGRRALLVSLAALGVTAALQAVVVLLSGSVALLGDTLHNVADAATALPLLVAFRLARRSPTRRMTYGYGRAEDLAGLAVVAMIMLSAALAAWESIDRLLHPQPVHALWAVAVAAGVGFVGNEAVAHYRIVVGRRIGSAALEADGLHARADGVTSLAVLLGAGGAALGWRWADPVIGLLITVGIVGVLRSAIRQVGGRLLDAVDPSLVDVAERALLSVDGVREVRELRARWTGHLLRAEVDLCVDPSLSVADGHALAHHAEEHLLAALPRLGGATIHVSPAGAH